MVVEDREQGAGSSARARRSLNFRSGATRLDRVRHGLQRPRPRPSAYLPILNISPFLTVLWLQGVTIHRPVIYGNTAWVLTQEERDELSHPDHTHRWTVAVRSAASVPASDTVGGADDLGYFIKRVAFKLHDTYPNPNRSECLLRHLCSHPLTFALKMWTSLRSRYQRQGTCDLLSIEAPGAECYVRWGEFEVTIRIYFVQESGEKAITFYHHLKLHPWTAIGSGEPEIPTLENALKSGPVHSWQYDEIVFNDPFQSFLNILTAHPPTILPKVKRRPVPFHTANPGSLEASKGGTPEFQQEMEKEEAERIEKALKQIVEDTHKWRNKLIEKENESNKLKKELEAATQP